MWEQPGAAGSDKTASSTWTRTDTCGSEPSSSNPRASTDAHAATSASARLASKEYIGTSACISAAADDGDHGSVQGLVSLSDVSAETSPGIGPAYGDAG